MPEREKADLLHAGNLLISRLVCELKGGSWRKADVRQDIAIGVYRQWEVGTNRWLDGLSLE
jgi:hypothetical protein